MQLLHHVGTRHKLRNRAAQDTQQQVLLLLHEQHCSSWRHWAYHSLSNSCSGRSCHLYAAALAGETAHQSVMHAILRTNSNDAISIV